MSITKEFFVILLICLSALGYHQARATDTVKQSIVKVKDDTASVAKTTDIPSETTDIPANADFAPGLLLVVSLALAVLLITAIYIVVLTGVLLFIFLLTLFGVVSTSVLIGLHQKSITKGFKAFILITTTILGLVTGVFGLVLVNHVFKIHLTPLFVSFAGTFSGLAGGLLFGLAAVSIFQGVILRLNDR